MTAKPSQGGSREYSSGQPSAYRPPEMDRPEKGGDDSTPTSLEDKQRELLTLQLHERNLTSEIARMRAFQTESTAFETQLKSSRAALDKDQGELEAFVTRERKALPEAAEARIRAAMTVVDNGIDEAERKHTAAADALDKATRRLEDAAKEVTAAEAKYTVEKQALSERKRLLGELKNLRKAVQDAHGRSELEVAGFWSSSSKRG